MHFFAAVFAAIALVTPTLASPPRLLTVEKFAGDTSGRHIVKLKEGVSKDTFLGTLAGGSNITHKWNIFNGFAGHLDVNTLNALRASPDVEHISEDGIMRTFFTQTNAPWGLSRLSQPGRLTNQNTSALTHPYSYDESGGQGVDVYVVDTGVYIDHSEFEGRAVWGKTFGGYMDADGNGHGTHVAGTVAGAQYGVAKKARIVAVKVLDDNGAGYVSDIVSGLQWVGTSAESSGRPSIASMSLGGGASSALDNASSALVKNGIHVTVAAGNSNIDAGKTSPARADGVCTVAASTISDRRASFSNFGHVVNIFAPGENIISAWKGGPNATNNISGTSMATPHIAGLIAYTIGKDGNDTPATIIDRIKKMSVEGALSNIPKNTPNKLAQNGYVGV
ncbi:serine proteinase [Collybia nuda]|uniref:Serine proteinase n=1 Tax=Collybia nuda TaxID=64659 RepID=A0A9P5YBL9_9AGAR|nr:serine proteinase [Collybia nuda]